MRARHLALLGGVALAIGGTLAGFTAIVDSWSSSQRQQTGGIADIGGPFTLTGTDGEPVTEADLVGKPSAVFFGFTFCPDICPTTLYELSGLIDELGSDADKLNFVFVSVDWQRDGPEEMKSYLSAFDERIVGLTGTQAQIDAMTRAYKVYYQRVPVDGGGYTIDHTASVLLMDSEGRFFGTITYHEAPDVVLAKLRRLIDAAS